MDLSIELPVRVEVPEQAFAGDEPLVAVMRGSYVGSLHRGILAAVDAFGSSVLSVGDTRQPVFLRSAAKPFQVMPAVLADGIDRYGISPAELAVLCASHSAEPRHMEAVLSVLAKIGLDESALRCGAHPPLHEETARQRWRQGLEPTPLCNNCSGAHAGMLLACRAMGWPMERYGDPEHALQRTIRDTLGTFAGIRAGEVQYAVDNCAVPTFYLPLMNAALAFARLASGQGVPQHLAEAAQRVVGAMTSHPEMVGGEGRFDTDLMRCTGGALVAKGGAEGFQGVGTLSRGLGVALKISDGGSRAVSPAMMRALEGLGALDAAQLDELARYREPDIYNLQNELVGRLTPVFAAGGIV